MSFLLAILFVSYPRPCFFLVGLHLNVFSTFCVRVTYRTPQVRALGKKMVRPLPYHAPRCRTLRGRQGRPLAFYKDTPLPTLLKVKSPPTSTGQRHVVAHSVQGWVTPSNSTKATLSSALRNFMSGLCQAFPFHKTTFSFFFAKIGGVSSPCAASA